MALRAPSERYDMIGQGGTPLHDAVANGTYEKVLAILVPDVGPSKGVNTNVEDKLGNTPLHLAAARARVKVIKLLLQHKASVRANNKILYTPLHLAVGDTPTVEVLLRAGADPRAVTVLHQTPLHLAAMTPSMGCVKLLVESGSNLKGRDSDGRVPAEYAMKRDYLALFREMLPEGEDLTPDFIFYCMDAAVKAKSHLILEYLIKTYPDVAKKRDKNDLTLLHTAAMGSGVDTVAVLLDSKRIQK